MYLFMYIYTYICVYMPVNKYASFGLFLSSFFHSPITFAKESYDKDFKDQLKEFGWLTPTRAVAKPQRGWRGSRMSEPGSLCMSIRAHHAV